MRADIDGLREKWEKALGHLSRSERRAAAFEALVARYREPHRHYHTLGHIFECLRHLDDHRALARDPAAVEIALWFHDAVYDGARTDNEARSADVAEAALLSLDADPQTRTEVRRLILLTRHDVPPLPDDLDGQLMVDIDLAPLGASPQVFDENGANLRREFAHLDDAAYVRGRDRMLSRMLDRPRIYCTDAFATRFEEQARANLRRTLAPDRSREGARG